MAIGGTMKGSICATEHSSVLVLGHSESVASAGGDLGGGDRGARERQISLRVGGAVVETSGELS